MAQSRCTFRGYAVYGMLRYMTSTFGYKRHPLAAQMFEPANSLVMHPAVVEVCRGGAPECLTQTREVMHPEGVERIYAWEPQACIDTEGVNTIPESADPLYTTRDPRRSLANPRAAQPYNCSSALVARINVIGGPATVAVCLGLTKRPRTFPTQFFATFSNVEFNDVRGLGFDAQ